MLSMALNITLVSARYPCTSQALMIFNAAANTMEDVILEPLSPFAPERKIQELIKVMALAQPTSVRVQTQVEEEVLYWVTDRRCIDLMERFVVLEQS